MVLPALHLPIQQQQHQQQHQPQNPEERANTMHSLRKNKVNLYTVYTSPHAVTSSPRLIVISVLTPHVY